MLPRVLAEPICILANKLGSKPWLDYSRSLIGFNFRLRDENLGFRYENLEVIRRFTNIPDEPGFYLTHLMIDSHSPKVVKCME
jgi:hypothetical protein